MCEPRGRVNMLISLMLSLEALAASEFLDGPQSIQAQFIDYFSMPPNSILDCNTTLCC